MIKNIIKSFLLFALFTTFSMPAFALSTEQTLTDYIDDFVDTPEGALNWKVFSTTKAIELTTKTEDGYDWTYQKPDFTPEVKALDGREITIKGFMFPLEDAEEQGLFLFGPFPVSCPFHYHAGPSLTLEVHAEENPVKFSYEPVTIAGRLELVPDDPEFGIFYRLKNAGLSVK